MVSVRFSFIGIFALISLLFHHLHSVLCCPLSSVLQSSSIRVLFFVPLYTPFLNFVEITILSYYVEIDRK